MTASNISLINTIFTILFKMILRAITGTWGGRGGVLFTVEDDKDAEYILHCPKS